MIDLDPDLRRHSVVRWQMFEVFLVVVAEADQNQGDSPYA